MEFDTYTLVLLRRGRRAAELSDDEVERLQSEHLAHLAALRRGGALLVAGPFRDQDDQSMRGVCIYGTGLEEARRHAEQDPAVQAGRLEFDAVTWLTPKGALAFAGAPTTREEDT